MESIENVEYIGEKMFELIILVFIIVEQVQDVKDKFEGFVLENSELLLYGGCCEERNLFVLIEKKQFFLYFMMKFFLKFGFFFFKDFDQKLMKMKGLIFDDLLFFGEEELLDLDDFVGDLEFEIFFFVDLVKMKFYFFVKFDILYLEKKFGILLLQ